MRSDELPYEWAKQLRSRGKTLNCWYQDTRYYSYSTCIGEIIYDAEGKRVYLINDGTYSPTTSKHQCYLNHCVYNSGDIVLRVPRVTRETCKLYTPPADGGPKGWARYILMYHLLQADKLFKSAERRRKQIIINKDVRDARKWLNDAKELKRIFKLRHNIPETAEETAIAVKKLEQSIARTKKQKNKKDIAAWLAGREIPYRIHSDKVLLRVVKRTLPKTDGCYYIETIQGSSAPYEKCRQAFLRVNAHRKGSLWDDIGGRPSLAGYKIHNATHEYIKIGCHSIKWTDIVAFAKTEGWVP